MNRYVVYILAVQLSLSVVSPVSAQEVYFNDFEAPIDPLSEWSNIPENDIISDGSTTPGTPQRSEDRFLGQFSGSSGTSLTLNDLPAHTEIIVSFDLYILRTWDGNGHSGPDIWDLSIQGGPMLLHTTFSNTGIQANQKQDYPDNYPGGDNPARTGADESNTLGFTVVDYSNEVMDTVYHFYGDNNFDVPHTEISIVLDFSGIVGSTIVHGVYDESWGLDNVRVEAIPEPCTIFLLALGGAALLKRRKM